MPLAREIAEKRQLTRPGHLRRPALQERGNARHPPISLFFGGGSNRCWFIDSFFFNLYFFSFCVVFVFVPIPVASPGIQLMSAENGLRVRENNRMTVLLTDRYEMIVLAASVFLWGLCVAGVEVSRRG